MSRDNLTECRWANNDNELAVEENRQLIWETPEVFAGALNVRVLTSTIDATRRTLERLSFERINGQKASIDC